MKTFEITLKFKMNVSFDPRKNLDGLKHLACRFLFESIPLQDIHMEYKEINSIDKGDKL